MSKHFEGYLHFQDGAGEWSVYNDIETRILEINKFKGWMCKNNNVEVGVGGSLIRQLCTRQDVSVVGKNILDPVVCPLESCTCQGLLSNYKEKISSD
jgi:hypothetical protein